MPCFPVVSVITGATLGAVYRMNEPKVVILIFSTGKLVITGAKREGQVHEAADKMKAILMEERLLFTRS